MSSRALRETHLSDRVAEQRNLPLLNHIEGKFVARSLNLMDKFHNAFRTGALKVPFANEPNHRKLMAYEQLSAVLGHMVILGSNLDVFIAVKEMPQDAISTLPEIILVIARLGFRWRKVLAQRCLAETPAVPETIIDLYICKLKHELSHILAGRGPPECVPLTPEILGKTLRELRGSLKDVLCQPDMSKRFVPGRTPRLLYSAEIERYYQTLLDMYPIVRGFLNQVARDMKDIVHPEGMFKGPIGVSQRVDELIPMIEELLVMVEKQRFPELQGYINSMTTVMAYYCDEYLEMFTETGSIGVSEF